LGLLAGWASVQATDSKSAAAKGAADVRLGNFSVSLTVKDLEASCVFYEKLGFKKIAGDAAQRWLVLGNDSARIGLFQGMFEHNMLTFHPGWDRDKKELEDFDDVRTIQKTLKQRGLTFTASADESTTGPAYFMLTDPDGNPILVDQHVPSPKK
jgi:catechol 2,3-dioxygenase-like lactoylglutathione lyase family enzyme